MDGYEQILRKKTLINRQKDDCQLPEREKLIERLTDMNSLREREMKGRKTNKYKKKENKQVRWNKKGRKIDEQI